MGHMRKNHFLSSAQIIILGFVSVITAGTLLLMLPISARTGHGASFWDALFTSTSAVCVTGLVVRDTATYWSLFGQMVILALIQIGGMGVVTVGAALAVISGRRIGLMQRSTMQEAVSAPKVAGIVRLTNFIIAGTFLFEGLGAAALLPVFVREYGAAKGAWYSVFHSVSAFCNAGFDLMGEKGQFSSLTSYADNIAVNVIVMLLIIAGGIGFITWEDIRENKFRLRGYRLQSKVVLLTSVLLILVPALFFYFFEWGTASGGKRLLYSFFQAVTPRTAGFNTMDLSAMSEPGQLMIIILMLIGGSPGSTAGGMKTTTIAVLMISASAVFRRKHSPEVFDRRIMSETVHKAAAIFLMYIFLFVTGGMAISCIEGLPMLTALFETASAVGTVGLTLGVTPSLTLASRLILTVLMFFGRVGGLTVIFATVGDSRSKRSKLPQEKIMVG